MLQESSNIVAVYYPPYAGGKFVINCLGFNELCCPSIPITKNSISQYYSADYYLDQKIPTILKTVPESTSECLNWTGYELSCGDFWGNNAESLVNKHSIQVPTPTQEILKTHMGFFVVHSAEVLFKLKKLVPQLRTIQLVNYQEFRRRAMALKTLPTDTVRNGAPPVLLQSIDFNFDMSTIFDCEQYVAELGRCWAHLGVNNKYDNRLLDFYNRYIKLHQQNSVD
jgi:hypothetical protein